MNRKRRDAIAAVIIPAIVPFESLFDGACEEFVGVMYLGRTK